MSWWLYPLLLGVSRLLTTILWAGLFLFNDRMSVIGDFATRNGVVLLEKATATRLSDHREQPVDGALGGCAATAKFSLAQVALVEVDVKLLGGCGI